MIFLRRTFAELYIVYARHTWKVKTDTVENSRLKHATSLKYKRHKKSNFKTKITRNTINRLLGRIQLVFIVEYFYFLKRNFVMFRTKLYCEMPDTRFCSSRNINEERWSKIKISSWSSKDLINFDIFMTILNGNRRTLEKNTVS